MPMSPPDLVCRRCSRPIVANAADVGTFEGMHWLCFHLEFEHRSDPDVACMDPSCPWLHIRFYREALRTHGVDPDEALREAVAKYCDGLSTSARR